MHLCECGCGNPTTISTETDRRRGYVAGQPHRFIRCHSIKPGLARGERHWNYKGGTVVRDGYRLVRGSGRPKLEHVMIVERALGKRLSVGAVVHHVNGDTLNNRPGNLVACQDTGYHQHLHMRQRAYEATGNANARKCRYCHQWDVPDNIHIYPNKRNAYHKTCKREYDRVRTEVVLRAKLAVAYAVVGDTQ